MRDPQDRSRYRLAELESAFPPFPNLRQDQVPALDLSGMRQLDPAKEDLVEALLAWDESHEMHWEAKGADPLPGVVRWVSRNAEERILKLEVQLACRDRRVESPLLLIDEGGVRPLFDPPERLAATLDRLRACRLLTYYGLRGLATRRDGEPARAKGLGRLARDLAQLGWLVDRGYATSEELEALGEGKAWGKGRPRLWESLPAFAADLTSGP